MLLPVPDVLTPAQVKSAREALLAAEWVDGKVTAGHQSARAKRNRQVPEGHPAAKAVGDMIVQALAANKPFTAAALPHRIFPPLFNRYGGGDAFGTHVDNAVRFVTGTAHKLRTDVSVTLFLTDPADYDGGELVVEDTYGVQKVKLPAGHLILYPSTSLHHVTPVTRGERISSFFWIQSLVRDDGRRAILYDLDTAIQKLSQKNPDDPVAVQLTGVYHNLLRQWAEL